MKLTANRGRSLETIIVASQASVVRLDKLGAEAKWLPGGKAITRRGPVDFVGTVIGTGRSIVFDAKQSDRAQGLYVHHYVEPHQVDFLCRHGAAGAIAGLLVEATNAGVAGYYWIDWRDVGRADRERHRVAWEDMTRLGPSDTLIRFNAVPGVQSPTAPARAGGAR